LEDFFELEEPRSPVSTTIMSVVQIRGAKAKEAELRAEMAPVLVKAAGQAKAGDLAGALEILFKLEKKARLAMIHEVTKDVALEMLKMCHEAGDWASYRSTIVALSKRRQQHSTVIGASVKSSMPLVDKTPDKATKLQFVETLRTVTEGKIFLEVQRARLTRILVGLKEEDGDIDSASSIMQEVQVETFGTMEQAEKVEFILEQIRLCLAQKDWVRVQIIQKKIDRKAIDDEKLQELKLRFYRMLNQLYAHEDNTLALARSHLAMHRTKIVQEDAVQWKNALTTASLFVVLSAHGKDQSDLLNRTQTMESEKLKQIPQYEDLLKQFTTQEIIAWPLEKSLQETLGKHSVFSDEKLWGECLKKWTERLRKRVLQHNVRVMSKYYSRVRLGRLAELIGLPEAEAERLVADMVSSLDDDLSEPLYAKIDRPAGIISFARPLAADAQLSNWAVNISKVLDLVEKTKHLIDRENMVSSAAEASK